MRWLVYVTNTSPVALEVKKTILALSDGEHYRRRDRDLGEEASESRWLEVATECVPQLLLQLSLLLASGLSGVELEWNPESKYLPAVILALRYYRT